MRALGVDLGKHLAVGAVQYPVPVLLGTMRIELDDMVHQVRLEKLTTEWPKVLAAFRPHAIFIEDPPYVRNLLTFGRLCNYLGVVVACTNQYYQDIGETKPHIVIVNNKWAKKELLKNGNAKKDDIRKYIGRKLVLDPDALHLSEDECDALFYALLSTKE